MSKEYTEEELNIAHTITYNFQLRHKSLKNPRKNIEMTERKWNSLEKMIAKELFKIKTEDSERIIKIHEICKEKISCNQEEFIE